MKVAWFTPFNKESAIGKYSKVAVEVLSDYIDVELFVYKENNQTEFHQSVVKVNYYQSVDVVQDLVNYDLCVYNMGDNAVYHSMIYDILRKKAGIVIAHDICMHNFMRGYYFAYKKAPEQYVDLLRERYGNETDLILKAANSVDEWSKMDLLKYHFSESIYENALGVVVHSEYHRQYLEEIYHGPILVTPLLDMNELKEVDSLNTFEGYNRDKLNVLTVGVVNPNKHIDKVIQAIGNKAELARHINYTIIGNMGNKPYVDTLRSIIDKYDLRDSVKLLGYVEDKELQMYYQNADIVTNLRYPALEGGSASLVEQLLAGKGTIVTDTGVYAEVPDGCVFKVDSSSMEDSLEKIFQQLVDKSNFLEETEKKAKEYAANTFSRERYRKRLYDFLESVLFTLPLHEILQKCKTTLVSMETIGIREILSREIEDLYYCNRS